MSTVVAQREGISSSARDSADGLRRHLESNLRDLWDLWPAPVWIANRRGEIVYANRTARDRYDGAGMRSAAARIAEKAGTPPGAAPAGDDEQASFEVSSLIDGCGEPIGWLAFGTPI